MKQPLTYSLIIGTNAIDTFMGKLLSRSKTSLEMKVPEGLLNDRRWFYQLCRSTDVITILAPVLIGK